MIIRYLKQNDVAAHDRLSAQAFVYPCEIDDPASVLPCEKVLGAFDDDGETLFADFELYERTCRYDGGVLTCAAVGGVAAKPEHRGKGAVKALFDHLLREENYDVSILYPFSEAYYRRFGYERVGAALCAAVPFAELSAVKRNQDAVLYEGDDPAGLLAVYNRCAAQYNLAFTRQTAAAFSDKPYLSQSYTYVWKNRSFATFSVDRAKSTVFVKELYYDSPASMLGIVGFLRNFEANQKTVCFQNLPADTPLLHYVRDLHSCEITLHAVGAARVLRFETVLRAHAYPPGSGAFTVGIGSDVYRVTYGPDGVTTERNPACGPDVTMDVGRASQILLCGASQAPYLPGVAVHNPETDFFRLFPPKTTFFSDSL